MAFGNSSPSRQAGIPPTIREVLEPTSGIGDISIGTIAGGVMVIWIWSPVLRMKSSTACLPPHPTDACDGRSAPLPGPGTKGSGSGARVAVIGLAEHRAGFAQVAGVCGNAGEQAGGGAEAEMSGMAGQVKNR